MARYILLHETASTNTYLKRMAAILPSATVVYTHHQTAGRGQKGNSWEAEPGKNLTFSMLIKRPAVAVTSQFRISEAVTLAITDELTSRFGDGFAVKWPNDIYWHDRKICGILIELSLDAKGIEWLVAGAGINVNQETFVSDAPNPVSVKQITGAECDLEQLLHATCERIERYCDFSHMTESDFAFTHKRYLGALYRNDGKPHTFALPDGQRLQARIVDADPDGMLVLRHETDDSLHRYAFKQVSHVINENVL